MDGSWSINTTCGSNYGFKIINSTDIRQEILFDNPFNLTIISSEDPFLKFKEITHDKLYLDQDPAGEIILGILVLFIWVFTAALFLHRVWRHLKHHTFRDYFRERRNSKYLAKQDDENQ